MKLQKNAIKLALVAAGFAFASTAYAQTNAMKSLNTNDVEAMVKLYEDLDQDGIMDSKDHCPNTALGATVGANGCTPVAAPEINTVVEEVTLYQPIVEEKIEAPLPEPIFTMRSTLFDLDKATLRTDQIGALRANLSKLNTMKPTDNLLIMGHTCDLGSDRHNMGLSWRRAQTIQRFIATEMPNLANRIYIVGRGENEPMVSNTSESNRQQNRRVEIRVLPGNQILPSDASMQMPAGMAGR
ncbi:MAG: OmpA family protein [Thiotrichales bacterium]|nr:OmpA family protein [Thiotrichales bacterium]